MRSVVPVLGLLGLASPATAFIVPAPGSRPSVCMRAERGTDVARAEAIAQTALATLSAGALITAATPAWADSTGKYSTKQTAKKRYLPRINRGVLRFQELGNTVASKPKSVATAARDFAKYVDDDFKAAMLLYGSSTRAGELEDDQSRKLERDVADFVTAVNKLAGSGANAQATYDKASSALSEFLVGAKLPPLGSPQYQPAAN